MTAPLLELLRRRDDALRDLVDLDRQLDAGELSPAAADELRRRYEAEAANAIAALAARNESGDGKQGASGTPRRRNVSPRRPTGRQVLYAVGLAVSVAVVVMIPQYLTNRPAGGLVSGNEVAQQAQSGSSGTSSAPRDLGSVSDAQMEKVIAANPGVIGMRLALAARYVAEGRYDRAVAHYAIVLKQDPGNAEAEAHLGWIMLQLDRPQTAARFVGRAIRSDPSLLDALWFQANIRLYGLRDAAGAVQTLDKMTARFDLTPQVRRQVERLRSIALNRRGPKR